MKGLLRKDLDLMLENGKIFIGVYLIAMLFLFVNSNGEQFFVCYTAMISSILVLNTISYDDFDNGLSFMMTLPITRKAYVKEKYLFGLLFGAGGWLLGIIIVAALSFLHPVSNWAEFGISCLIAGALICGVITLMIPIQLKYGSDNSRFAILGVVLLLVAAGYGLYLLTQLLNIDVEGVVRQVVSLGVPVLSLIAAAIMLGCMAVSYAISVRILCSKEL